MSFAWEDLVGSCVQDLALQQNLRVGGRGLVDARPKAHSIGLLTSPHGSALSHSGATQVFAKLMNRSEREEPLGVFINPCISVNWFCCIHALQLKHCRYLYVYAYV